MRKPFAQRFLELLPPKTLADIIDFIQANGASTSMIVRAGRSAPDSLPVAFWPLDAYSTDDHRQQALTGMSIYISAFDVVSAYEEETYANWWQALSAMRFGNAQDKEFKAAIRRDDDFDNDDALKEEDLFDPVTLDAIKKTEAYRRASSATKAAFASNLDWTIQLRKYGLAVEEMMGRAQDRAQYVNHFGYGFNSPSSFSGDIVDDSASVERLKGDLINTVARSADPQFSGGLKKFLKKGLKFMKPLAGFVPGGSLITKALSLKSQFSPRSSAPLGNVEFSAPESPGTEVLDPTFAPNGADGGFITLASPQGQVLSTYANMYLNQAVAARQNASRSKAKRMSGDISETNSGDVLAPIALPNEGFVPLPAFQLANGDVVIAPDGETLIPVEIGQGDAFVGGMLRPRMGGSRSAIGRAIQQCQTRLAALKAAAKNSNLDISEFMAVGDIIENEMGRGDVTFKDILDGVVAGTELIKAVRGTPSDPVPTPVVPGKKTGASVTSDDVLRAAKAMLGAAGSKGPDGVALSDSTLAEPSIFSAAFAALKKLVRGNARKSLSNPDIFMKEKMSSSPRLSLGGLLGDVAPDASGLGEF